MEACLALARLRAAQTQLLELEVRHAQVKERASSAAVANAETLQASMGRITGVIASLNRVCERVGTAGLVAQLQQPFTSNVMLALPAHHRHKISVTVDAARGLRPADVTGTSDPFAEVYIGDHRGKRRIRGHVQKTATVKHTLNPRWNETFTFNVNDREVSSSSLVVKLLDWDRFTRNDKLGYFWTPLAKVMATPYQDNWFPLVKNLRSNMPDQGQLHLIISVDGKGPSAQPAAQAPAQPMGAAAPYQPPYGAQPAYMGGGQQQPPYMGGGQQQPAYMGGGQPMMQPPQQQPQQPQPGKYPGLGSSFTAPPPAQAYPPPAGMPGYQQPPQQPMAQAPYGGQPGFAQSGAYPPVGQQQPPAAGYPPQAAPFGLQPQNAPQSGLATPASYIPSIRPPQ